MIGAIAGDIIGSVYENLPTKRKDFSLLTPVSTFTDDTVLTAALAVFLARKGAGKDEIRQAVSGRFGYDLSRTVDGIRPGYRTDLTCQGSVPEAIIAFLDSESFEDAVRNAVSLGGDADTQACIAGAIAEAHYRKIPVDILRQTSRRIAKTLWTKAVEFYGRFGSEEVAAELKALESA